MKKLLYIIVIITSVGFSQKRIINEPYQWVIISETKYKYDFVDSLGEIKDHFMEKYIVRYDTNGNKIEEEYHDSTGNRAQNEYGINKTHYKYDVYNNEIEVTNYDLSGSIVDTLGYNYKTIYEYGTNGNIIKKSDYDSNIILITEYVYKYDFDNNLIEDIYINSNGRQLKKYIHKYNSDGYKIETNLRMGDSNLLLSREIYKYDAKNNMVEMVVYDMNGNLRNKNRYEYNSNGYLVKESLYGSIGYLNSLIIYKHDSSGNLVIKSVFGSDNKMIKQSNFKYAYHDKVIEKIDYRCENYYGILKKIPDIRIIYDYKFF